MGVAVMVALQACAPGSSGHRPGPMAGDGTGAGDAAPAWSAVDGGSPDSGPAVVVSPPRWSAPPPATVCEGAAPWCWISPPLSASTWKTAAATSAQDLWIGGATRTVIHYDGASWTTYDSGLDFVNALISFSAGEVWAGGKGGIVRCTAGACAPVYDSSGTIEALWGVSAANLYAIEDYNLIQIDAAGGAGSVVAGGISDAFQIAGTAADDVWVSTSESVLHFDGQRWGGSGGALEAYYPNGLAAAGRQHGFILDSDGAWTQHLLSFGVTGSTSIYDMPSGDGGIRDESMLNVVAADRTHAWTLGDTIASDGATPRVVRYWDGTDWQRQVSSGPLLGAGVVAPDGAAFAVGWTGAVARLQTDGTAEDLEQAPRVSWSGVWAPRPESAWVVGEGGAAYHFDGKTLAPTPTGLAANLNDVWGTDDDDVWAVGDGGVIVHNDGTGWSAVPSGSSDRLVAVWTGATGDVWAGGGKGALLRIQSGRVTSIAIDAADGSPLAIGDLHGRAPDDVWGGGSPGNFMIHFDGVAWSAPQPLPTDAGIAAPRVVRVWEVAPDDVWAQTWLDPDRRGAFHFDGINWTPAADGTPTIPVLDPPSLGAEVSGNSTVSTDGSVWWVGDSGAIVRSPPR